MRKIKKNTKVLLYVLLIMNLVGYVVVVFNKKELNYQMNLTDYKQFGMFNVINYKVLTSMFIHENYQHLLINMLTLVLAYLTVSKFFNPVGVVTTYFVSGITSNIVYSLFNQGVTVGASSGVFGLLGLVISLSLKDMLLSNRNKKKTILFMLIVLGLLMGVFGVNANVLGHLTGLGSGVIIGILLVSFGKVKI